MCNRLAQLFREAEVAPDEAYWSLPGIESVDAGNEGPRSELAEEGVNLDMPYRETEPGCRSQRMLLNWAASVAG